MEINKEELLKGYISFKNNKYYPRFYNTLNQKTHYLLGSDNFEDAYKTYCTYQFKFYSEHQFLLPKFITFRTDRQLFIFSITFKNKENKERTIQIYSAKSLQEVTEYRKQFIANLL